MCCETVSISGPLRGPRLETMQHKKTPPTSKKKTKNKVTDKIFFFYNCHVWITNNFQPWKRIFFHPHFVFVCALINSKCHHDISSRWFTLLRLAVSLLSGVCVWFKFQSAFWTYGGPKICMLHASIFLQWWAVKEVHILKSIFFLGMCTLYDYLYFDGLLRSLPKFDICNSTRYYVRIGLLLFFQLQWCK